MYTRFCGNLRFNSLICNEDSWGNLSDPFAAPMALPRLWGAFCLVGCFFRGKACRESAARLEFAINIISARSVRGLTCGRTNQNSARGSEGGGIGWKSR